MRSSRKFPRNISRRKLGCLHSVSREASATFRDSSSPTFWCSLAMVVPFSLGRLPCKRLTAARAFAALRNYSTIDRFLGKGEEGALPWCGRERTKDVRDLKDVKDWKYPQDALPGCPLGPLGPLRPLSFKTPRPQAARPLSTRPSRAP